MRLLLVTIVAASVVVAQVDPKAVEELDRIFDRPAGTVIQQPQKDRLAAWLKAHEGKDLGNFGYAKGLALYLERDVPGAVLVLDRFVAEGRAIANEEHRTMAGRVFLNAVVMEARADAPDEAKLARFGEAVARFYRDTAMLARLTKPVLARVKNPAAVRVALAKGALASDLGVADKDVFLRELFGSGDATLGAPAGEAGVPSVPATAIKTLPPVPAPDPAGVIQPGQAVEPFALDRIVNGPADFTLANCQGKVVVLDFFASWCAPCRAAVPAMIVLQKAHADDLRVLGVTRYYGRGMDFSGEGATSPHGGTLVMNLDHDREAALYRPLVELFGINYPIVFPVDPLLAAKKFGVSGIPTMVVIGRDGKLVGRVVGGGETSHEQLLGLVAQALKAG